MHGEIEGRTEKLTKGEMETEAVRRRLSARRGGRRSSEIPGRRLRPSSVLGKRKNESGGSREGRRWLGADLKRPGARGARSHDAEWGGCGMRPGRAVPRSAGVKTAPTSGPGRSAAGRGAWAVAWCGRRRGCWAESGGWAERGRGEEGERAAREKDHVGRK